MNASNDATQLIDSEERANVITHALGLLAGLIGMPFLVGAAWSHGDIWRLVACSVFAVTFIGLYAASTVYHLIKSTRAKEVLQVIDHAAIFLFIAGSYTPFTLGMLHGTWNWTVFGLVWAIAIAGVVFKAIARMRYWKVSIAFYLVLGWMAVLIAPSLAVQLPWAALALLIACGLCYTAGVPFFLKERMRYAHAIWHVFVIGGSVFHGLAVLFFAT
jgi:hemolysin III